LTTFDEELMEIWWYICWRCGVVIPFWFIRIWHSIEEIIQNWSDWFSDEKAYARN
jgi:hypothetical protein